MSTITDSTTAGKCVPSSDGFKCGDDDNGSSTGETSETESIPTTTPEIHGDPYCVFFDTNEDAKSCKPSSSQPDGACEFQCLDSGPENVCNKNCRDFTCFCKKNYIRTKAGKCVPFTDGYQCGDDEIGSSTAETGDTTETESIPTTTPEMHGDPYCVFFDTNEDPKSCKSNTGACEWQCQGTDRVYVCDKKCRDFTCFCKEHFIRLENGKCVDDSYECGVEYSSTESSTPEIVIDPPYCYFRNNNEDTKYCSSTTEAPCEWQCHNSEKSYVCVTSCEDPSCFCKENYIRLEDGRCVENSPEYQCEGVKWEDCTTPVPCFNCSPESMSSSS